MDQLSFLKTDQKQKPNTPGLLYIVDYITPQQQHRLIVLIDELYWLTDFKRRMQHYGYKYDYKARNIDQAAFLGPLPECLNPVCDKLLADEIFPKQGWGLYLTLSNPNYMYRE